MGGPTEIMGEAFGKARGAAKQLIEGYGGIFRRLAEEHGEVTALMKRISMAKEDSDVRRELFPKLRQELLAHAHAEEREFYAVLKGHESTRDLASHSTDEHKEIEAKLGELLHSDPATPAWSQTFDAFMKAVQHHVDTEENEVFAKAKNVLTKEEIKDLERRFDIAKKHEIQSLS